MPASNALHFDPWIGKNFAHGFRDKLKLLVMGASHYGEDRGAKTTQLALEAHIKAPYAKTWTSCEKLLNYCLPDPLAPSELWHSVAFANFIQVCVPDRQTQPLPADWKAGTKTFPALLDRVRPDVVLALGWKTWNSHPWPEWQWQRDSLTYKGDEWGGVYHHADGRKTVSGFVYHPASPAWRAETWYLHVERLLTTARTILP